MRRLKLMFVVVSIFVVFGSLFNGNMSLAAAQSPAPTQTLKIIGALGAPGDIDPVTRFSLDGGETWNQAFLYGSHPWGLIPDTESWINCGPSGTEYCVNRSVLYSVQFVVPEDFSNPHIKIELKADNLADVYLNEIKVMHVETSNELDDNETANAAVHAGLNEILIDFTDTGGWSGINYKITLDVESSTPPIVEVQKDVIAPITTDDAPMEWANQGVTVNLTATDNADGSGVAATYYTIDDGEEQSGTSVVLAEAGEHTISYWSVDNAGNEEAKQSKVVKIDIIAPSTTDDAPMEWANQGITVNLSAADNADGSGVAATYYTIDDGEEQSGTSVELTEAGEHTISYWSVDNAGNEEAKQSKVITLKFPPLNSDGQFHINDLVYLMNHGASQQIEMNGDGIFDRKDLMILLEAVTPVLTSLPAN